MMSKLSILLLSTCALLGLMACESTPVSRDIMPSSAALPSPSPSAEHSGVKDSFYSTHIGEVKWSPTGENLIYETRTYAHVVFNDQDYEGLRENGSATNQTWLKRGSASPQSLAEDTLRLWDIEAWLNDSELLLYTAKDRASWFKFPLATLSKEPLNLSQDPYLSGFYQAPDLLFVKEGHVQKYNFESDRLEPLFSVPLSPHHYFRFLRSSVSDTLILAMHRGKEGSAVPADFQLQSVPDPYVDVYWKTGAQKATHLKALGVLRQDPIHGYFLSPEDSHLAFSYGNETTVIELSSQKTVFKQAGEILGWVDKTHVLIQREDEVQVWAVDGKAPQAVLPLQFAQAEEDDHPRLYWQAQRGQLVVQHPLSVRVFQFKLGAFQSRGSLAFSPEDGYYLSFKASLETGDFLVAQNSYLKGQGAKLLRYAADNQSFSPILELPVDTQKPEYKGAHSWRFDPAGTLKKRYLEGYGS